MGTIHFVSGLESLTLKALKDAGLRRYSKGPWQN